VTLTDRDRKIILGLLPVLLLVGYWFLVLSPKRQELSKASEEVTKQVERRDAAQSRASQGSSAKTEFASDYTQVVRLGKAIPAAVDMPGLIVQLDRASAGTGIRFTKIATGEREESTTPTPPPSSGGGAQSGSGGSTPAAAGGEQAQSAPGGAAEAANNAATTSDNANAATDQASGGGSQGSGNAQGSGSSGGESGGSAPGAAPTGLETVPLELEFQGNFFNLADFFHRVKRLVRVANNRIAVSGRLVTIENVKYTSDPELFPMLRAELNATIYLVPAAQGTAAGATPQGPSATTPAQAGSGGASPAPAATAAP